MVVHVESLFLNIKNQSHTRKPRMYLSTEKMKVFQLDEEKVDFYIDEMSRLYWTRNGIEFMNMESLPWDYQLPFYLRFLHDDSLMERLKNLKIIGAIDVYIKCHYFFSQFDNYSMK